MLTKEKDKDKRQTQRQTQRQIKRTYVNEKIGSCEVDHPARNEEEENSWFKNNPTTVEGSKGGKEPLLAINSPIRQPLCVLHFWKTDSTVMLPVVILVNRPHAAIDNIT